MRVRGLHETATVGVRWWSWRPWVYRKQAIRSEEVVEEEQNHDGNNNSNNKHDDDSDEDSLSVRQL